MSFASFFPCEYAVVHFGTYPSSVLPPHPCIHIDCCIHIMIHYEKKTKIKKIEISTPLSLILKK